MVQQVKPFALAFVNQESIQSIAALTGIDLIHAGVVEEYFIYPCAGVLHSADRAGEFQALAFRTHGAQSDAPAFGELLPEGFAPACDDDHALVQRQHYIDDAALGPALSVHCGSGCDFDGAEQIDIFSGSWIHGELPPV